MDSRLTWSKHLHVIKQRGLKALNLMKKLSSTKWGSDRKLLLRLYCSHVRSILDYGSIIYGSASNHQLKTLDTIRNQALRFSYGAFCTTPYFSLHAETCTLPLSLHRNKLSLLYLLSGAHSAPHRYTPKPKPQPNLTRTNTTHDANSKAKR